LSNDMENHPTKRLLLQEYNKMVKTFEKPPKRLNN